MLELAKVGAVAVYPSEQPQKLSMVFAVLTAVIVAVAVETTEIVPL
jgi:hypothetical protein